MREFLQSIIRGGKGVYHAATPEGIVLADFVRPLSQGLGIIVCGEIEGEKDFFIEHFYPYLRGRGITTREEVTVEKRADKDAYAGSCDDPNVGVSLVFAIQNRLDYIRRLHLEAEKQKIQGVTLSGLAMEGRIMMPIGKNKIQRDMDRQRIAKRNALIAAAKGGDEDAIESLTTEDMDTYNEINRRITQEDIFTLVDSYIMPYGIECDQYSVLGEITQVEERVNALTEERIYLLTICTNELTFDICINIIDLFGEPQVGRRFKGNIWLQGFLHYEKE